MQKQNAKKFFKGYVTVTVLILMMVLVAAAYIYMDSLFSELIIARNNKSSAVAFSIAEAGVQEAIYRIQYDPVTRNTFLNTASGATTFSHNPSLLANTTVNVTIQNITRGAATITALGNYQIGIRNAQRQIQVSIAQATNPPPYDDDAAMYTHSAGGESTGDLEFQDANLTIYGGSIASGRDIRFEGTTATIEKGVRADRNISTHGSALNCDCLIEDDGLPETAQCSENPGCSFQTVAAGEMPEIDFDSSSLGSYKNLAINNPGGSQYFATQADFFTQTGFNEGSTKTFNGVVYIEGTLDIDSNRVMVMNGVLASSGTISVGKTSGGGATGTLTLTNPGGGAPAGVISQHDIIINRMGNFSGTGLVYSGTKVDFQSSNNPIDLTGGILSRRIIITSRTVTIHFDATIINDTLDNPSGTPVIEINHWEEEY